jgi:hypothetical protein
MSQSGRQRLSTERKFPVGPTRRRYARAQMRQHRIRHIDAERMNGRVLPAAPNRVATSIKAEFMRDMVFSERC